MPESARVFNSELVENESYQWPSRTYLHIDSLVMIASNFCTILGTKFDELTRSEISNIYLQPELNNHGNAGAK